MSDQQGNFYGADLPVGAAHQPGNIPPPPPPYDPDSTLVQGVQPPAGPYGEPSIPYIQPYVEPSGPVTVLPSNGPIPMIPPPPRPLESAPARRSPLLAILLGLMVVAAAAFAFLWHKASNDTDTAKRQVTNAQTQLSDANSKAAADLAAAKKAADAAAAADKQALDAATAKAAADAAAAAAKAQSDQAAAVAKATADAQGAGQATAADLQKKLDAATAAMTAAQATANACKAASDAMTALTPDINALVKLRDAEVTGDTATAQTILTTFDLATFNSQVDALNAAQTACKAG